jgi:NAD(P)-dependent dehydrogenase (short-subunit alcohol dehydrogenase family)
LIIDMSGSKVLLVLGAGGNIGASVASLFAENGYKVAIAARRLKDGVNDAGQLQVQMDLSKPETVDATFDKVTAKLGPPNVIVYNGKTTFIPTPCSRTDRACTAAGVHPVPAEDPLSLTVDDLNQDMIVNTGSALAAAKKAVAGFDQLPSSTSKAFIYTGNFLNKEVMPFLMSAGMGKSATAHLLATAASVYGPKGYG